MKIPTNPLYISRKWLKLVRMLITDQNTLETFCAGLAASAFITIDTEFLREKTYYPKLCLIQISGPDKNAAAVDPLAEGIDLTPVFDLLFNPAILKIFHAGRQDMEIFYNLTGQVPAPLFDTQIAAMVCGYGDSVGYDALVRGVTGAHIDKSVQYTNWALRPLSDKQLTYALGDVTHLIDVYHHLSKELERKGRTAWVQEEEAILCAPATYENDPSELWRRIKIKTPKPKNLAVLQALAVWREGRAQERDVPRPWILRDETLADIAGQLPRTDSQLAKIRGIPDDLKRGGLGQTLLGLIETTLAGDSKNWPELEKRNPLPPSASATVDILRMLLKIQSTEHGVATKLLASGDDLDALAMDDGADIPATKGWRYDIFGQEALALKKGALAIGLKDGKIVKYKVSPETETQG